MIMKTQQSRLELKPKHALANAEWPEIEVNTGPTKPLQRGAIFRSSSETTCLTSDSLLKQLANIEIRTSSLKRSTPVKQNSFPFSSSRKQSHTEGKIITSHIVEESSPLKRKNDVVAAIDDKIMSRVSSESDSALPKKLKTSES